MDKIILVILLTPFVLAVVVTFALNIILQVLTLKDLD
jgi:hypothetical protein